MYQTFWINLPRPRCGESRVSVSITPALKQVTEWARMYARSAGGTVTVQEHHGSAPFLEVHADGAVRQLAPVTFPEPEPARVPPEEDRSCPDCGCVGCWCN